MTATHRSRTHQQPAFMRRLKITFAALALSALGVCFGAPASQAAAGSVYFDANNNAAAGDTNFLFNATFLGARNVGLGRSVMPSLTGGNDNVAIGDQALTATSTGGVNVAVGSSALADNTTGVFNVATGARALENSTTGLENVAVGNDALNSNTTGGTNVGAGSGALLFNTTGNNNVALGRNAGRNLTTGSNNVDIANPGKFGESGTIRIGTSAKQTATFIAGISGVTVGGATQPVVVGSNGKLGVAPASKAAPLSAAQGKWLMETVKRQQRQIERLRAQVNGGVPLP